MPHPAPRPAFLALLALSGVPALAAPGATTPAVHAWDGAGTPAALESWVQAHLKAADADLARLAAVKGPRTVDNTLAPYDEAYRELQDAENQAQILYGVGATKELRDKGQELSQSTQAAITALNLDPQVYHALSAVPQPADAATRHYLERTLLEYRLAGVDKDEATRAKIKALQDRITERGLVFDRNTHDDVRTVVAEKSQLGGLPPDLLASHSPMPRAGSPSTATRPTPPRC
jgi:thimet oligopeptidase